MIETNLFQINLIGIITSLFLLFLLYKKTLDLISILALTSSFYNLVIFNFKPWTFGFQIFFLFAIISIIKNIQNFLFIYKNKELKKILILILIFLFAILFSLLVNILDEKFILTLTYPEDIPGPPYLGFSKIGRFSFTQFLYLLFYFLIVLSIICEKTNLPRFIRFYLYGLNINLCFQLLGVYFKAKNLSIPNILNNLSFLNETIQGLSIYSFKFYRFSGLFPSSALLGIYLFIAFGFLVLFKNLFSKKFFYTEVVLINLNWLLGFNSTYILGLLMLLLIFLLNSKNIKNALILFFIFILILFLFLVSVQKSSLHERFDVFLFNLNIFLKYPILGIGWARTSGDLFSSLLANSGIIGFLTFIYLFYKIFKGYEKERGSSFIKIITLCSFIIIFLIWNAVNVNIFWILVGSYLGKKYDAQIFNNNSYL